jgi:hypothetical protein
MYMQIFESLKEKNPKSKTLLGSSIQDEGY